MKQLSRDIQITLLIKLVLLIALWFFCFKGTKKNTISTQQWLFGSPIHMNIEEVHHDSRQ